MNIGWWLERSWWDFPEKEAVVNSDDSAVSYSGLRQLTNKISNVLRQNVGIVEDDIVLTVMADHHVHVAILFAVWRLGAVFSGLNRQLPTEQLIDNARRVKAKLVIIDDDMSYLIDQFSDAGIKVMLVKQGDGSIGSLLKLASTASDDFEVVPRSQSDTACINFTSGTSGNAKGVIFTHGTLANSALASIFLAGVKSDTRNISIVGMFHSGGVHDSIRLIAAGATILWSNGWDVDRVVHIFKKHAPNFMYWIGPTPLRQLMSHPDWESLNLSGMKMHIAGEVVPPEMEKAIAQKGAIVGKMYGLTEAMPVCILSTSLYYGGGKDAPATSSGKPNREFCAVKLKDPFTGEDVDGVDVEGEICAKGDVITPGYFEDPDRTAQAFDQEGYLHTRDLAFRDRAGWYHIRGRAEDVIVVGGEKVSLLAVDRALLASALIADAACVGVKHESLGEVVAAFVTLRTGMPEGEALATLDADISRALPDACRPRVYKFVASVPRTAAKRSKMLGEMRLQLGTLVIRHPSQAFNFSDISKN